MDADIHATSILSQGKAEEFEMFAGHYAHNLTFPRIHLEFQLVLQVIPAGFQ